MSLLTEIVDQDKYYTWQLRGKGYTCTFTSCKIMDGFRRMHKVSQERNGEDIDLFLYKNNRWEKYSSTQYYKKQTK